MAGGTVPVIILLAMALAFAGCLIGPDSKPDEEPARGGGCTDTNACIDCGPGGFDCTPRPDVLRVPLVSLGPPVLTPGTTWTYDATGVWDVVPTYTVVALQDGQGGWVFGAAEKEELWGVAMWGAEWAGPRDANLNPRPPGAVTARLFDWPLEDNRTWPFLDTTATARAAKVHTPEGPGQGFRMEAQVDGWALFTWEYEPRAGYLTRFTVDSEPYGVVYDMRLREVTTSTQGVWFEAGPYGGAGTPGPAGPAGPSAETAVMNVTAGFDAIILIGLGDDGTHGVAVPPGAPPAPWTFEGSGFWDWQMAALPATEGAWTFAVGHEGGGAVGVEAIAVRWLDLAVA